MAHERSDQVWFTYQQASEKFDYFILGLSGALTGYLGQHLELVPLGFNGSTAELFAVISLGFAMVAGFKRIEWGIVAVSGNHAELHAGEAAGVLSEALSQPGDTLNLHTGERLTRDAAAKKIVKYQEHKAAAEGRARLFRKLGYWAYHVRNWALLLGGLAMIGGKVLRAYGR